MGKTKKYIFKAESGNVKLIFHAKDDTEANIKLGAIVQNVSYFTKRYVVRLNKKKKK
jgi:hypothetical protein